MTRYLQIKPRQSPSGIGLDPDSGRVLVVFNFDAFKGPSDTFEEEIVSLITSTLGLTLGTDLFVSEKAVIPDGPGPYVLLVSTTGLEPEANHNSPIAYERPGMSVTVIAGDDINRPIIGAHRAAMSLARAVHNTVGSVRNQELLP